MMTEIDLDAIKARADAATSGPWEMKTIHPFMDGRIQVRVGPRGPGGLHGVLFPADAEFIAHARTDVPTLLAEVERQRAELAVLYDRVDGDAWERKEAELAEAQRVIADLAERLDWIAGQAVFHLDPDASEGAPLSDNDDVNRELLKLCERIQEKAAIIESPDVLAAISAARRNTSVGSSAAGSNETRYRVGRSVGRTLYDNGVLFGLVDTAEQAQLIVAALNSQPAPADKRVLDAAEAVHYAWLTDPGFGEQLVAPMEELRAAVDARRALTGEQTEEAT